MVNVKQFLKNNADLKYADFNRMFIISKYPILGVRIPLLRKFAKDIEPEYINLESNSLSHEEILLYGFSAGNIKNETEQLEYLENILPYFDNWATCDSIVPSLKQTKGEKGYQFYSKLLESDKGFYVRAGIVGMMRFFIKTDKLDDVLKKIQKIKQRDRYVQMATAWFYAELCTVDFEKAKQEIKHCTSPFIKARAIAKAKESYRVSNEQKAELDKLR